MGIIFEELICCFNEENNDEVGEYFIFWDVVKFMVDLIFLFIGDLIEFGIYFVYDGVCGIGGMLMVVEERLVELV